MNASTPNSTRAYVACSRPATPTPPTANSHRTSSPYGGPRPTDPKPYSDWTTKRVPLTGPTVARRNDASDQTVSVRPRDASAQPNMSNVVAGAHISAWWYWFRDGRRARRCAPPDGRRYTYCENGSRLHLSVRTVESLRTPKSSTRRPPRTHLIGRRSSHRVAAPPQSRLLMMARYVGESIFRRSMAIDRQPGLQTGLRSASAISCDVGGQCGEGSSSRSGRGGSGGVDCVWWRLRRRQ